MPTTNVGIHPLDDLNKEARKLLKKTRADAIVIVTVRDGVEIAAAGHMHFGAAAVVASLRAAADQMEREAGSH